jgi:lysophospholipase L1-like esterase
MKEAGVPVNDLHKVVEDRGREALLGGDGTHYTQDGYERLAEAVTNSILRSLAETRQYSRLRRAKLKAPG